MNIIDFFARRQIVINPKLQFGVVSFFVGLSLINISFFLVAIYFSQNTLLNTIVSLDEKSQKVILSVFTEQYDTLLKSSLIFSLFSLSLAAIMGIALLNHVAGPIHAVKVFLEEFLAGTLTRSPLKFRKHDFFPEISALLNQLSEKCKNENFKKDEQQK